MKHVIAMTAVLVGAAGAAQAQEAGNPAKGAAIARQVCAECHAVDRGAQRSPNGAAPAFDTIAATPGMTSIALTAALRTSHRRMPNIILAGDDLRDVIAYVLSLK